MNVFFCLQEECSRNSQSTLTSKDKSKASSVSRIEHKALVHHSAMGNSPDAVTIELPEQLEPEDVENEMR